MPRPRKCRRICALPRWNTFGPLEGGAAELVEMAVKNLLTDSAFISRIQKINPYGTIVQSL